MLYGHDFLQYHGTRVQIFSIIKTSKKLDSRRSFLITSDKRRGASERYSLQPSSSVRSPQLSLWSQTYCRATQCPLVHLNSSSVQGGSVGSRPAKDTIGGLVSHRRRYTGEVEWRHLYLKWKSGSERCQPVVRI